MSIAALLVAQATAATDPQERHRLLELAQVAGLREGMLACTACDLRAGCRTVVPWSGPARAPLAVQAEAPGREEDDLGQPLVGACGRLLDEVLAEAALVPADVPRWNGASCRPPGNRTPTEEELQACEPWWRAQFALIDPWVVLALGNTALFRLRGDGPRISAARGRFCLPSEMPGSRYPWVMPTWHPSYVLRQGGKKSHAYHEFRSDVLHAVLVAHARDLFPLAEPTDFAGPGGVPLDLDGWRASALSRLGREGSPGVGVREMLVAATLFEEDA